MPRKSAKQTASATTAAAAPAPVVETKSAAKSAAKSAPAKKRSAPKKKAAAPAPVVTPEPVVATPAPTPATSEATTTETFTPLQQIDQGFSSLSTKMAEFKAMYATINTELRALQKNIQRYMKDTSKRNKRNKSADPNRPKRQPSGFAKPALISNALCSFLGKPEGTEMARTEVTKYLTQYIKNNELQDQENRRKIVPDAKLKKLLNVNDSDEVTYFNLQKYMKVHFPKSASAST